jgi:hypothetical protein
MKTRTALTPDEALAWGLVHEIKTELFEIGSEVISIQLQRERGKEEAESNPLHAEPTYSSSGGGVTGGT